MAGMDIDSSRRRFWCSILVVIVIIIIVFAAFIDVKSRSWDTGIIEMVEVGLHTEAEAAL
jgi:uncharacterized membrane protein YhaH (DUF805 family)